MKKYPKPTMLLILDGFGVNPSAKGNAIKAANTPNFDKIFSTYPNTTLGASGLDVGLPPGQMGNSEVGHLNIGAGRIVYQELTRISKDIEEGGFFENEILLGTVEHVKNQGSALHLMGLLSDGGVHSHQEHLFALLDLAKARGLKEVYVHCFLDGRDVPPRSALTFMADLEAHIKKIGLGQVATVSGRYYAMDRDKRWDRVEKAYEAMTLGLGEKAGSGKEAIEKGYTRDENDEFLLPTVVEPASLIKDNDGVIFFNFRPDRAREITRTFVDPDFNGFTRKKILKNLSFTCLTQYDITMPRVKVAYPPQSLTNTLGEYLAGMGLTQLRIAETEKYAHVTFFFNGGVEEPNKNEDRVLINSPKVPTYDLQPEMSAYLVADAVIDKIKNADYDLIVLNFANADMVGHTGIFEAAVKAIEAIDSCVGKIVPEVLSKGGQILLTADHGNADYMLDDEGAVVTAHSLFPVPLAHLAAEPKKLIEGGVLADLAPTLLDLMGIEIPKEMTGKSLIADQA